MTSDQRSELCREISVLEEEAEDLRASAEWWRTLYEEAIRRRAELEAPAANTERAE
jgi:hypothetical protein